MLARRLRCGSAISATVLLLAVAGTQQAHAGLFDDEEARRQINDLSIKVNERVDTLSKAQIELLNQIQSLREDNAKLRGAQEQLARDVSDLQRLLKDVSKGLDDRLRTLEPQKVTVDGKEFSADADELRAKVSGSGEVDALDFPVKSAYLKVSGSGNIRSSVLDFLDVDISGSGNVYYEGNPQLDVHISGSGDLRKL